MKQYISVIEDWEIGGLEYQAKQGETPFDTFLRYTDEKERLAEVLANIFRKVWKGGKSELLDIGTGTGQLITGTLAKSGLKSPINLTLLEPANDLLPTLKEYVRKLPDNITPAIVTDKWERFHSGKMYDLILASHLYHIPQDDYFDHLSKMVANLNKDGILIFVMREIDDTYHFKTKFNKLIFGESFTAKTVKGALETFDEISQKVTRLDISKQPSVSTLSIPLEKNIPHTISIIEFFLNKPWEEIPDKVRNEILIYLKDKDGHFKQLDGVIMIRKA